MRISGVLLVGLFGEGRVGGEVGDEELVCEFLVGGGWWGVVAFMVERWG